MIPLASAGAHAPTDRVARDALAAVPVSAQSTGCVTDGWNAGDRVVRLTVNGMQRSALVHVPARAVPGPAPLVLGFHGVRGSGREFQTFSGLSPVADRAGFIAVYPDASLPTRVWNAGSGATSSTVDDVAFVSALLDEIERGTCVDLRRVTATGVSNGGGFVGRLACALSTRLAGVAIVAGALAGVAACPVGNPVSVLEMHGTADPIASYWGHNGIGGALPWLTRWLARDRCDPSATLATVAVRVKRFTWRPCLQGTVVEHLVIAGGRHQWPGSHPAEAGPTATISAAQQVWAFLAPRRLTAG